MLPPFPVINRMSTQTTANPQTSNLDRLAGLFIHALPTLSADDQALALTLYRMLTRGKPVSLEQLAQALDTSTDRVSKTLDAWPGVFYDSEHRIVALWGLSTVETQHRLEIDGGVIYAWCAWDSLFLPELLDSTVKVTSHCPATGDEINLTLSPDGIESIEPASAVVSFLAPNVEAIKENVTASFCHFVYFFRSRESGEQWAADHPGTFILSIGEAFTLGKKMNAARYKNTVSEQVSHHE